MNELTIKEKTMLLGILTLVYERKEKLMQDENIGSYIEYLKQDLRNIESINRKLALDMKLPESVAST